MSERGGVGGDGGNNFFSFPPPPSGFHGYEPSAASSVYDSAGMLSEMFDFAATRPSAAPAELLGLVDQQNPQISGDDHSSMHLFLPNHHPQFTWIPEGGGAVVESQGLSLSLASSLEAEELRIRNTNTNTGYGGSGFFNAAPQETRASVPNFYQHLQYGYGATSSSSVFSLAAVNVLRNSKFSRPAQDLLDEFCSVGRGVHYNNNKNINNNNNNNNLATTSTSGSGGGGKDLPPLSPADRMEHQRRKVKLVTMLDEVERRYSHYCEHMQMVVNSFDMVMGFGAASPYTGLAQKAMSRHFRCLKDGIHAQLRQCCEVLGEKESGTSGITKGETPRLKMLEQSLRKQRAFHQMGIMEQEAWRPQRGLPERSVNVLRAWLFEHFLHPYPSDADKHLLARQTGLSRNQVANWFINARVRLWKPMIEEMYQQESKQRDDDEDEEGAADEEEDREENSSSRSAQTATTTTTTVATGAITSQQINENDPSSSSFSYMMKMKRPTTTMEIVGPNASSQVFTTTTTTSYSHVEDNHYGTTDDTAAGVGSTMIRFGTTGDVSLTLGLRHGAASRNPTDNTAFSFGRPI